MLLKGDNAAWAANALKHAEQLYKLATQYQGSYQDAKDPVLAVRLPAGRGQRSAAGARLQNLGGCAAGRPCVRASQHSRRSAWPTASSQMHGELYESDGYKDELAFAAAMLFKATGTLAAAAVPAGAG